jgi:hypothetical protein
LPCKEFLEAESSIVSAIARLAGNAPLDLIIRILHGSGLAVTSDRIFDGFPDRVRVCAELRAKEVEAILAGDAALAELYYGRASDLRKSYLAGSDEAPAPVTSS